MPAPPRSLFLRRSAPAALLALAFALSGCEEFQVAGAGKATLTYTDDARAAYDEAMASYRSKSWEEATALFGEVKRLFPFTPYAKLAELRLADIQFEQEKYSDAIAAYREWVQNHRSDRDVEYAKYRIAKALYSDIDDTVLLPPQEERDQATLLDAHRELRAFSKQFPESNYRADVGYMLEVTTGRLARHELYVARYYLKRDIFEAAIARADYALKSYPGSGLDAEALVLKGETLLKMHEPEEARKVFQQVIDDHGGPFAVTAKAFLDEMGTHPPPAKPAAP